MQNPENVICFSVLYLVPVTGNHYKQPCKYIGRDGGLHLGFKVTKSAKAYYDAVAIFAQGRTVSPQTDAERRKVQYSVQMDVYLGEKQRGDADNFLKCGLDALVHCGMIHSDAAVKECKAIVHKDERENPRTTYLITRMEE
jgi:Holliday junction resolvase RusA-like endonuclease